MSDSTNPFYATTFAERLALREAAATKQIDADSPDSPVEDKAVKKPASRSKKKV